MARRVLAVIPARLGSKRFPDKVIYPLNGKPLLSYVHAEILKVKSINRLIIATDNDKIEKAALGFGAEVLRTSKRHRTGTDRAAEVAAKLGGDIVLNIQADNFGVKAAVLDRMIRTMLGDKSIRFATLAHRVTSDAELFDPDLVKLIVDSQSNAIWFSRFPLPFLQSCRTRRRHSQFPFLGHIGIYGFRRRALEQFASWKRTELEKAESLEQLRILENGETIRVFKTTMSSISVNNPNDLKKLKRIYR